MSSSILSSIIVYYIMSQIKYSNSMLMLEMHFIQYIFFYKKEKNSMFGLNYTSLHRFMLRYILMGSYRSDQI